MIRGVRRLNQMIYTNIYMDMCGCVCMCVYRFISKSAQSILTGHFSIFEKLVFAFFNDRIEIFKSNK